MPLFRRYVTYQPQSIGSAIIPATPTLNQQWDEIDDSGTPIAQWYWNGTIWVERQDRILNFLGWLDHPYSVPKITGSSGIWIKTFRSNTTGGEANSPTKYIQYRLGDMHSANSFSVIVLAVNESKTPIGRGVYETPVDRIYPSIPKGLNITHINVGGSNENFAYAGHSIIYRCIR